LLQTLLGHSRASRNGKKCDRRSAAVRARASAARLCCWHSLWQLAHAGRGAHHGPCADEATKRTERANERRRTEPSSRRPLPAACLPGAAGSMLRRLPRLLGAAGLRKAGCQPSAGAGVLRALQTAAGQGSASTADAPSPWLSVGKVSAVTASALLASQAAAEEAAPAPAAPPDPTSVLRGLKKLSDAKEVVLYQYATCPFCNKARARARRAGRRAACLTLPPRTAARVPGLPQNPLQSGGGEPADEEGAEVVHLHQGKLSAGAAHALARGA
jgi:hypothetical protein